MKGPVLFSRVGCNEVAKEEDQKVERNMGEWFEIIRAQRIVEDICLIKRKNSNLFNELIAVLYVHIFLVLVPPAEY